MVAKTKDIKLERYHWEIEGDIVLAKRRLS